MARTTSAAVEAIIEVDVTISLTPFIEAANNIVSAVCDTADTSYDATDLEIIERWLSAHIYTNRDPRAFEESVGRGAASEKTQSKVDLGFDTSHYGQTAMRLDREGGLAALNAQAKKGTGATGSVTWLGKTKVEVQSELD